MREMIEQAMATMENARISAHQGMRIKEIIAVLKDAPSEAEVRFDFCGLSPKGFDSYRGYYSDLAVGFSHDVPPCASDFLKELRACVGMTFEGYKGGEYAMSGDTPLWVSEYGKASGTAIVRVSFNSYSVTLHTAMIDD